jgi:class 3 adenylate cyclase
MSDRMESAATLEERMDDVRAVMDAAGVERAVLFGWTDAATMLALFAGTHPTRVQALIVGEATVKLIGDGKQPWGMRAEVVAATAAATQPDAWGQGRMLSFIDPSARESGRVAAWWRRYERLSCTPRAAATMMNVISQVDVRPLLPSVQAPTLVLHRVGARLHVAGAARYFADQIAGAQYREIPGDTLTPYLGDQAAVLAEVEEFVTGKPTPSRSERFLATVVFTDIVGSTRRADELGDAEWRRTLAAHHALVEQIANRHGGRVVGTAGDGVLAVFDGPTRAVNYASAVVDAVHELDLQVRAGIHTGEVERQVADELAGLAVHIGARVSAHAEADEVLVSSTVHDLTVGSGLVFADRGEYELKGVPQTWHLYSLSR